MTLPAQGKRPHSSTKAGERLYSDESRLVLKASLGKTFLAAAAATVCALTAAFALGDVHPTLPVHMGKVLQAIGGAFALWGTLFAVSGPEKTWGGGSVPERVHGFMFTCLLGVGGFLAILGTLL